MKITRTSAEIVKAVNEAIGMDISYIEDDGDIKIDTDSDAEGNEIHFHDYLFCGDRLYNYVNQQGTLDDRLYITLNSCAVDDDEYYNDKCFNRDGAHDDFCDVWVNDDGNISWTFDEDTFINVLEGLKLLLKVKPQQNDSIVKIEEILF